jgi:hypothetical protein
MIGVDVEDGLFQVRTSAGSAFRFRAQGCARTRRWWAVSRIFIDRSVSFKKRPVPIGVPGDNLPHSSGNFSRHQEFPALQAGKACFVFHEKSESSIIVQIEFALYVYYQSQTPAKPVSTSTFGLMISFQPRP